MKSGKAVFIPAIIVIIASILLVAFSLFAIKHGPQPIPGGGPPPDGRRPPGEGGSGLELFKTFGTLALLCGAISFSWLRFKNRLKSKSEPIKKIAKTIYTAHTYTGYAALIFILAGTYFLITKFHDVNIYTGLASFIILLTLAVYGWLIKRVRNKYMRKVHFLLSIVWIPALLLHAGGSFIMTAVVTIALWAVFWILERSTQPKMAA
jgi:hypothetical protein